MCVFHKAEQQQPPQQQWQKTKQAKLQIPKELLTTDPSVQ